MYFFPFPPTLTLLDFLFDLLLDLLLGVLPLNLNLIGPQIGLLLMGTVTIMVLPSPFLTKMLPDLSVIALLN